MASKRDLDISASSSSKHRQSGFDPRWSKDFPFVVYTAGSGMFCSVFQKWKTRLTSRNGTWITVSIRKDSILDHARSKSHSVAVLAEQEYVQARLRGGIAQSFDSVRAVQKKSSYWWFKVYVLAC